jgi:2',3'-cyclic-nucleotide 2'-phosphodiesterase (5'-nucleotidase family)
MTQRRAFDFSRLAAAASLVIAALTFGAASCEQNKPKTKQPTETTAPAATSGEETETTEPEVFEKKEPKTVGPDAPAMFALSGLKGYTEPCGCTLDVMLGGIDRIAGYVEAARKLYPDVAVVHAGNLFFESEELADHEIPQEKAKVEVVAAGLKKIGISHAVPGHKDFALGTDYYAEQLKQAGIEPIAVNLSADGLEVAPTATADIGDVTVRWAGVVDPELFAEIDGVSTSPPKPALQKQAKALAEADVAVLLVHGELPFAKEMLEAVDGVDFAVVGYKPRETDQTDPSDGGWTLEPYDQGRYLGILKLFNADEPKQPFANARTGSKAELEKIERQIEHVNKSINRMPPATPGEEPTVLLTLRRRLEELQARREEIKHASVEVPDGAAFYWRTVPMEPGYEPDPEIAEVRENYNRKLRELNSAVEREVPPVAEGEPFFVGSNTCEQCHAPATQFWEKTAHSRALATLEKRNKDFDQKCIGCHVVGYEKPGGSVLGKLEYDTKLQVGEAMIDIHKELQNVGCESCHGPGSQHRASPVADDGTPQHIIVDPGEKQCMECHVPEHSPRFNFGVYVEEITGEGHARGD